MRRVIPQLKHVLRRLARYKFDLTLHLGRRNDANKCAFGDQRRARAVLYRLVEGVRMTYRPPNTHPGPASSTLWKVFFILAIVALILTFASIGIFSERTASNGPAQPEISTVGQSRPPLAAK